MTDATQKPLQNTETFLDSIIDNIPLMIFIKDAQELRFVRFNKAAEELLGYKREEMLGKNDYDFFPKEQADFFTSKDRIVLNNKTQVNIPEEPIDTKHKGKRYLHTVKVALVDEEGTPLYLLGISEDITERKKSEEQLKTRSAEIDALNKALINREARMLELKNEIDQLNKSLKDKKV